MPPSLSASNSFAATPLCERMPIPTMLNLAMPLVASSSPAPISARTGFNAASTRGTSSLLRVNETSVPPAVLTFCTMMSITTFAPASAVKIFAAVPGDQAHWLRYLACFFHADPRTTTFSMLIVSFYNGARLVVEAAPTQKRHEFFANSTERDCITLDPLEASRAFRRS